MDVELLIDTIPSISSTAAPTLGLQTKVREDFTITEKAPTMEIYADQTAFHYDLCVGVPISCLFTLG